MLGIDFKKYKNTEIQGKNGERYLLSKITTEQIKQFDWAYMLAEKGELITFDYRDEMSSILSKFRKHNFDIRKSQGFSFASHFNPFDDIKWLRKTKDIGEFLANIMPFHNTQYKYTHHVLYIDNNNDEQYLLATIGIKKNGKKIKQGEKSQFDITMEGLQSLASHLGIKIFDLYKLRKWNEGKPVNDFSLLKGKKRIHETRNDKEIKVLADQERAKVEKIATIKIPDDTKLHKLAEQTFIKMLETNGDDYSNRSNVKSKILNALLILLHKKWAKSDELVEFEINDGYFFHSFEFDDEKQYPTVADMVFHIKERIEETRD